MSKYDEVKTRLNIQTLSPFHVDARNHNHTALLMLQRPRFLVLEILAPLLAEYSPFFLDFVLGTEKAATTGIGVNVEFKGVTSLKEHNPVIQEVLQNIVHVYLQLVFHEAVFSVNNTDKPGTRTLQCKREVRIERHSVALSETEGVQSGIVSHLRHIAYDEYDFLGSEGSGLGTTDVPYAFDVIVKNCDHPCLHMVKNEVSGLAETQRVVGTSHDRVRKVSPVLLFLRLGYNESDPLRQDFLRYRLSGPSPAYHHYRQV